MSVKLYGAGAAHARALIKAGKVDKTSSWSFSAEDGNALLGKDGNNWSEYAKWHLGENTGESEKTKGRYKYPFGKNGKVYRAALVAIRQRAGQQEAGGIYDAAGAMLEEIDKKKDGAKAAGDFGINFSIIQATGLYPDRLVFGSHQIEGGVPTEFPLLPVGHWGAFTDLQGKQRSFDVSREDLVAARDYNLVRKNRGSERDLVIDYNHASLKGWDAPAAGWIGHLEIDSDLLYATDVRFTNKARRHLEEGEYRYVSPVFLHDCLDKVTGKRIRMGVFQAALTNEPFLDELPPLMAASDNLHERARAGSVLYVFNSQPSQQHQTQETRMDDILNWLRSFLNLPLTATFEEIQAEMQKLITQLKQYVGGQPTAADNLPALIGFIGATQNDLTGARTIAANYNNLLTVMGVAAGTTFDEVKGRLVALQGMQAQVTALSADLTTLRKQITTNKFDGVIAAGVSRGAITPAQTADAAWMEAQHGWANSNFAAFSDYFGSKAPQIIPTGEIKVAGPVAASDQAVTLSDTEKQIARKLGVSEEEFAAQREKERK